MEANGGSIKENFYRELGELPSELGELPRLRRRGTVDRVLGPENGLKSQREVQNTIWITKPKTSVVTLWSNDMLCYVQLCLIG